MSMTEPAALPGETIWTEQQPFIAKQARDLSRSFNYVVEEEDLLQEAWVFVWQKEAYFFANNCRDVYVRKSIRNVMLNYAKKMRDQVMRDTDSFFYATEEVRELLPTFLSSPEAWASFKDIPDGASTMTKNDNIEIFVDFSIAWDRLTEKEQDTLVDRYGGIPDENDAFHEAMTPAQRQALSRAVRRFVEVLNQNKDIQNREYNGPGAYLTSNDPAKARISSTAAGIQAVKTDE